MTTSTRLQAAVEQGRALRGSVPRRSHADWPASERRSDPVDTLQREFRTLDPSLVKLRLARMATSPFSCLRGSVSVMADDASTLPATGISVRTCGDSHIANFGVFATSERALAFDMNDFDETTLGPWEWDLKRFATSLVLSGRQAGRPVERSNDTVKRAVHSYIAETHRLSRLSVHFTTTETIPIPMVGAANTVRRGAW